MAVSTKKLGMNAETFRNWIRQQQVDDGMPGPADPDGASSWVTVDTQQKCDIGASG
jgi:transposase-like protein